MAGGHRINPASPPLMNGMYMAKVLDIAMFRRLRAEVPGIGAKRLAKALGCGLSQAQALMKGEHWQQDPVKVRLFNEYKHASVNVETGVASAADLAVFGFSRVEKRAASAAVPRGSPGSAVDRPDVETEAVERMLPDEPPPARLDTSYFQGEVDRAIWMLLREFDRAKISRMNGRELSASLSALLEKRALLRGEPTAIVRNENRGSLEKVGELLLAEMARRGLKVGGPEMVTIEAKS